EGAAVKSRAYEIYRERGLRVGDVCTSWPGPHAENVNPRWSTRFESANSDGGGLSSMHRTLDGDVLVHHLTQDERLIDPSLLARHGRSARTLVKEGPL